MSWEQPKTYKWRQFWLSCVAMMLFVGHSNGYNLISVNEGLCPLLCCLPPFRAFYYCKACHDDITDPKRIKKCGCKRRKWFYIHLSLPSVSLPLHIPAHLGRSHCLQISESKVLSYPLYSNFPDGCSKFSVKICVFVVATMLVLILGFGHNVINCECVVSLFLFITHRSEMALCTLYFYISWHWGLNALT